VKRQSFSMPLLILSGISCLVLGAITAGPVWGDDYDDQLARCTANCERSYESQGYPSSSACFAAECAKYQNVRCDTCSSCGRGGKDNPCTKSSGNCGGAPAACTNGLCLCTQHKDERADGDFYTCGCGRPGATGISTGTGTTGL